MDKLNHPALKLSGLDKISIKDLTICYYCNTSVEKIDSGKCAACGFPQLGTEVEQKRFLNEKRNLKVKLNDYRDKCVMVRNMLLVIAVTFFVSYLIIIQRVEDFSQPLQGLIIVGLFCGLAFWAMKNPYDAIMYGIYLFAGILIIYFIHNPNTLFAGYPFKLVCIAALIYGWISGKNANKLGKELTAKKVDISPETKK